MKKSRVKKLTASLLAVLMLSGGTLPSLAAEAESGTGSGSSQTSVTLAELSDQFNTITYSSYIGRYGNIPVATDTVTIPATEYSEEETTAKVEVYHDYAGSTGDSLYIPEDGAVTWKLNVAKDARYAIKIRYYPVNGKSNSIERMVYINSKIPFSEARYIAMTKLWTNEYEKDENGNLAFRVDGGNELRPTAVERPEWIDYTFIDSNGYYADPFLFYFTEGENTFTLEGVREPVVIESISLIPGRTLPTYDEMKATYARNGWSAPAKTEKTVVKMQAEYPTAMSHATIYPINDRTSAINEPQDPSRVLLNAIGSDKWQSAGQWLEWQFEVEESGLYHIVSRYKQSLLSGLFTSRRLMIDGEVPFAEANNVRFDFSSDWKTEPLNDGTNNFAFYFEKGHVYTIRLEVTMGEMGEIIRQVDETLNVINSAYLEILKLTGASPDAYRDYGFARVMPDTIKSLLKEAQNLEAVVKKLEAMSGVKGENLSTLEQIAILLRKMGTNEDEIAKNLSNLKSHIGTLGTWTSTVKGQSLTLDYLTVQPAESELPRANASFWQSLWFEIRQFFASFFTDYTSLSSEENEGTEYKSAIEVWLTASTNIIGGTSSGRDEAQIYRTLINNDFTPNAGVKVNLKLVAPGTLLPSVLADVGPDVSLGEVDTINYAIRNAVMPLNDFDTFDEVVSRFSPAALTPISLYGKTYGLPETQTFPMMFYRKDILANLGLEIPKTWDDLLEMLPVLQYNNMEIGLLNDYRMFLYQMGGELYADDGMRINLDSNVALEAFETMCNMFTQYSLPYSFDFANRFRTGEMPIGIAAYTTYNQLIVFASEIAGLWEFAPLPGIEDENGNINNVAVSTVTAVTMLTGCRDTESAWDFMDWYVDKDFQADFSNERVAILGPAAKHPTANIEALAELPWTSSEYRALAAQFQNLAAVPNYPGYYIIDRYTNFAFLAAYNDKADPVESILAYINTINKEITRKREEFGLETLELGQTLEEKRAQESAAANSSD